ncbi:MAG: SusC/RagA family TonB-linked outer membrane protein [Bacteroidia bacterium]|nr:SusC/RagA family TonB-linked outer membrane protein [Bacteroidia bacterium]NNK90664.1 SusC/RagA family TonB-linked outer membrane protein [Saprospiraceae bacterium]
MKKLFTFCFTLALVTLISTVGFSQKTITGVVTDADNNEPLIGANVLIKGLSTGTITDIDGSYSLDLPAGSDMLVVSYAGYTDQEVAVGGQSVVNIALSAGALLDEIVVVGYGTVRKRDVTGSVASLKEEDFNKGIVVNPDQLIQGRVPGVNVTNNSGQPGGEATVKIRGNNSIRAGANPLYVIDGVPLDGRSARAALLQSDLGSIPSSNPLNFINPSDIQSIEILKDASSAAIYGSRGANGVVLVTTKKGRSGETTVDFGVSLGTSSLLKKYDVLDGDEYRSALSQYGLSGDGGSNVDAFDEILQSALTTNYALSFGGGTDNSSYRLSMGYSDQEGIVKETGIKKYNVALNSSFDLLDDAAGIDFQMITNHATEQIAPVSSNAGFTGNIVGQALQWNPTVPLMTSDGAFTKADNNPLVGETTINPLELLAAYDETANTTTLLGSISPYYNITDKLQYRYRYGINYSTGRTRGGIRGFVNVQNVEDRGLAGVSNTTLVSQLHSHTLNYTDDIAQGVSMTLLGGYEYQKFDFKGYVAGALGFTVQDFDNTNALQNSDPGSRVMFSFADPVSELQSYFGRANFNINDKYLFTATVRADGSSKFGDNNRYGIFPSAAFAWNLHNDIMSDGPFDEFKVRLGWGQTGNQEFPAGAAQERYELVEQGSQQENAPNPDLKWETSTTMNLGIDFAIFDYALAGTIEYFTRSTEDLLLDPFVSEPGPAVRAWRNIDGKVVNSGVELGLTGFIMDTDNQQLSITANIAMLNNEFKDYSGAPIQTGDLFGQGISGTFIQTHKEGFPLNTYFVREYTGLDESGNSTYTDDGNTFYELGDPNASMILGLSANYSMNDFSVGLNFNGAFGHELYNNTANTVIPIGNLGTRNIDAALLDSPTQESVANPITASSRYIEDGSFIKLANATVGYNIGDVGKFSNINVTLTGQNLFVITDYTGFDPEVNTVNLRNGVPSQGIEYIPYPSAKSFILSVGVSF